MIFAPGFQVVTIGYLACSGTGPRPQHMKDPTAESVENVLPEGVKSKDVLSVLKVAVAGIGLISALSAFS